MKCTSILQFWLYWNWWASTPSIDSGYNKRKDPPVDIQCMVLAFSKSSTIIVLDCHLRLSECNCLHMLSSLWYLGICNDIYSVLITIELSPYLIYFYKTYISSNNKKCIMHVFELQKWKSKEYAIIVHSHSCMACFFFASHMCLRQLHKIRVLPLFCVCIQFLFSFDFYIKNGYGM